MSTYTLHHGDCLEVMQTLDANSVDTVVTDPPYGLSFMGKHWDHGVPGVDFWREALRVAKPGAMLLAFGGTRTFHRLTVAIEDAGWEVRDVVSWLYGSGFPKSLDISKAIDKAAGAEREIVGESPYNARRPNEGATGNGTYTQGGYKAYITTPGTDAARLWDGWGTALKPAWEPIIMAMKPLDGTFAENAAKWGVAGLNVDGARIEVTPEDAEFTIARAGYKDGANHISQAGADNNGHVLGQVYGKYGARPHNKLGHVATGRWPANLLLDEDAAAALDAQSGERPGGAFPKLNSDFTGQSNITFRSGETRDERINLDSGGASRFFYCAKSSRSERGQDNAHPTVKPIALMRYLVRLTSTPTGGVVLDPFMGSGTTGVACMLEGRSFVGIDKEAEYVEIARRRIAAAELPLMREAAD